MSRAGAAAAVARGGAWAGFALLALLGPALVTGSGREPAIDWDPSRALAEPWRLWSAAWVHLNAKHLAVNALGAVLVGALGVAARLPWRACAAWATAWPLTHAALWLRPDLASYGGLSGVLHAGVAVAAVWLLRAATPRERTIGAALLGGLALKVVLETPWRPELPFSEALDIATVPLAHAAGAIAGTLCGGLWSLGRSGRAETRPSPST